MSKYGNWVKRSLNFLVASTVLMLVVPGPYLRALASIILIALARAEGEDLNLGTVHKSLLTSLMALAITLTILILSEVKLLGNNPTVQL